jgi:hypothetical protein
MVSDDKAGEEGSVTDGEPQAAPEEEESEAAAKGIGPRRKEATVAPMPPTPSGQPVQFALGMQLIQQSSFEGLGPDIQKMLIDLARTMDEHAFENAQESMRGHRSLQSEQIADGAAGRKQLYVVLGALACLGLIAGTSVTMLLIFSGEHQLGHTVMMSGLAVVSALLGGAGLSSLLRRS